MFVSARVDEVRRDSGDWVFVDIGFAQRGNKSCGVALNDGKPCVVEFGNLATAIFKPVSKASGPFFLVIEAPLSVAFDEMGNPVGRSLEKRGNDHRYWYESSGCRTMVAASYLLRALFCRLRAENFRGQIRLVEGFLSFKKGPTPHGDDVKALRRIVWGHDVPGGRIVEPSELAANPGDFVTSAFAVSGMDFGVPPVVEIVDEPSAQSTS